MMSSVSVLEGCLYSCCATRPGPPGTQHSAVLLTDINKTVQTEKCIFLSWWIIELGERSSRTSSVEHQNYRLICMITSGHYYYFAISDRGEVVRRRVPAPGSADPISQSDKLKLYIVIIMILCVIISRCYSLLRDFPDQVNLSPSALEACWQDSQPDLHTDHTRRRNQQDLLPAGPSTWPQSALQTS